MIKKIKAICHEIQNDLIIKTHKEKMKNNEFLEIRMTKGSSIFLEKSLDKFDELKENLIFRKNMIFEDKYSIAQKLSNFPNIYIYKKEENMNTNKEENNTPEFIVQKPEKTLDKVILPPQVKEDILLALSLIEYQKQIYEDWGFSEVDSRPKLILNFYGPPGTGKTMVSHAIANELGKNILAINYAEIESKYVGDAPKNLFKAFETASKEKAVLFFDEADSFLGKRIEDVKSSSDQAINSLRSQMLILLENFDGVVIFATNLAKNYDRAFESRILKHIHFDLPDAEGRKKIIDITIPSKAPLKEGINKEELCSKLAEIAEGFSGREIKNAVLESLTFAAQNQREYLDEEVFIKGFENTKEKIKRLEEERKKASPINQMLKKKIEDKIKENIEKEEDNTESTKDN